MCAIWSVFAHLYCTDTLQCLANIQHMSLCRAMKHVTLPNKEARITPWSNETQIHRAAKVRQNYCLGNKIHHTTDKWSSLHTMESWSLLGSNEAHFTLRLNLHTSTIISTMKNTATFHSSLPYLWHHAPLLMKMMFNSLKHENDIRLCYGKCVGDKVANEMQARLELSMMKREQTRQWEFEIDELWVHEKGGMKTLQPPKKTTLG